ncbi:helix-turn-helix domain-containing protein [Litchfieldia alkalitelluris]|uniref:helix-turn-helix domain-containing protein n=1 Tax=Litchfieldia alkalitelluris TaxID=304268 RepID=UPI000997B69C|nr:helix-turn-helix transcriptional regulator [Litchfieldia alkalitelluris]
MSEILGKRIKKLRTTKGMTLKELGEAIDFNYSNLSKIERGQRKPTIEVLECLASYFNIHISYFFGEERNVVSHQKLDPEWILLTDEMKKKNITPKELKDIVNHFTQNKKLSN